ncbi:efflux RND transporter periplasmic adaptor subunit [Formosa algae]|uniref:HlyD family secretion protein n=1 Tax=Formosa algae TaxID=225843 RepID=A0A9X0YHJ1_9FLAO|nr:efflux RND transporter periplasmic adaptor subunit [Formosa algae]MBP1838345.1 HlyD family secretion protein [Formosa algae]MDQ0334480.1 HlyD family secretion protein [Formosa algae]OEI82175.1 efflux transporter periplasmic adaptor subunit [Formosa algae]
MKKKKLILIISIIVALLALLVIGKKAGWFGKQTNFKEVETQEISTIDIIETVSATGKIQPEIEVKLSSEVSGEIIALPVREGQEIEKGDLLVKINPDIYQSSLNRSQATLQNAKSGLDQAEASLKEAKASYVRNKTLFEKGIIAKADWDKAISAYEVAEASKSSAYYNMQSAGATVNEANDNLNRTTIFAPMSGTISKLDAELGERVVGTQQMAGTEIMRVANLNNMEVEVDVNENDIVKVSIGDSTIVEVDAYLKKEFKGIVTEIANSADEALTSDQVTNFKVKVRILEESYSDLVEGKPKSYSPFRPGMTATVDIITKQRKGIIGVPISAIVIKNDTTTSKTTTPKTLDSTEKFECVFVKEGELAKLRVVKTGIQDNSNIEIISGLETGDLVIVGPYNMVTKTLKSGDKVGTKSDEEEKTEE